MVVAQGKDIGGDRELGISDGSEKTIEAEDIVGSFAEEREYHY